MEFFQLINVKMPTIVGILTFMSGKNSIVDLSEPEKCQPTLKILPFGSEQLTDIENRQIFIAVQQFLIKSKRFEIV